MNQDEKHFLKGVALFNHGQFFEAHEEMEEAMNLVDDNSGDWEFYLGLLRAAVASHKLGQGEVKSAEFHLKAALRLLAPYPDRHHGVKLCGFRDALGVQLTQLSGPDLGDASAALKPPQIEMDR